MNINKRLIIGISIHDTMISATMKITTKKAINYETMKEEKMTVLSICGDISNHSSGQIYDSIMNNLDILYVPKDNIKQLIEIWKEYHLNDLQAGTKKQMDCIKDMESNGFDTSANNYYEIINHLEEVYKLGYDGHYKYGSNWLCKPIPQNIIDELIEIFSN